MRLYSGILLLALSLNAQHPFLYNRPGGLDPLTVGMKNDQPIAIDWDEDGRTDILQRNIYSTTFQQPWWGIFLGLSPAMRHESRHSWLSGLKSAGQ